MRFTHILRLCALHHAEAAPPTFRLFLFFLTIKKFAGKKIHGGIFQALLLHRRNTQAVMTSPLILSRFLPKNEVQQAIMRKCARRLLKNGLSWIKPRPKNITVDRDCKKNHSRSRMLLSDCKGQQTLVSITVVHVDDCSNHSRATPSQNN